MELRRRRFVIALSGALACVAVIGSRRSLVPSRLRVSLGAYIRRS
jgi:hypothetical protein